MQGTVKSFTLSITLGVVRGGSTLLDAIHLTELLNQHAFKIPPLVRMDTGWGAKTMEPLLDQHSGHRGGPLVFGGKGLRILRKDISQDQNILPTITCRFQNCEVNSQDLIWLGSL